MAKDKKSSAPEKSGNNNSALLLVLILITAVAAFFIYREHEFEKKINALSAGSEAQRARISELENGVKHNSFLLSEVFDRSGIKENLGRKMEGLIIENIPPLNEQTLTGSVPEGEEAAGIYSQNIKILENCKDYGPRAAAEYIVPGGNSDALFIVMNRIKELSDDVCKGAGSEEEKAFAIAMWICDNIYYDYDASVSRVAPDVISLENALSGNKTTCAGFSNLFSAMCHAQGICSINIRGGATANTEYTLTDVPKNHEWTAAYCEGRWLFYDTALAAGNSFVDGEFHHSENIRKEYLGMDAGTMSADHRVDSADMRNFFGALEWQ